VDSGGLAIDYFGRTAGTDYGIRGEEFTTMANLIQHLGKLTPAGLDADITKAVDHLRAIDAREVVALGFCCGGRQAFRSAAARFGLAGVIGFYGCPDAIDGAPGPTQLASELTAPLLAFWGGADESISPAVVQTFGAALTEAGCPHEFVTYPGAPHGFFELGVKDFAQASAGAWQRVLDFLADYGGRTGS
jgi:carboxymethylenebutenolidase